MGSLYIYMTRPCTLHRTR